MEYIWCMDSLNRERLPDDHLLPNPTNDIKIKTQLSVNRMAVTAIELASLELPRVQRLIEREWSRLYMFDGFPMQSSFNNLLQIDDGVNQYDAKIPYLLLPVSISTNGMECTVTSRIPHLLAESLPVWKICAQSVQLIGLPEIIEIESYGTATTFTFTFTLNSAPAWTNTSATLYYAPLPSPEFIALLLSKSLNASFQTVHPGMSPAFTVGFDLTQSRLFIGLTEAALKIPALKNAKIIGDGGALSLTSLLGFSPYQPLFNNKQNRAMAAAVPYGTKFIELDEGDYSSTELTTEIQYASNSTYLKPPAITLTKSTDIPLHVYYLSIGTDTGSVIRVSVPSGMYTPMTLAITLTELLSAAWPTGQVTVLWNLAEEVYVFLSQNNTLFSLEFDVQQTNIARNLGFNQFRYACAAEYKSSFYVNPQTLNLCGTTLYGNTICQVEDDLCATKITFYISNPNPLPVTGTIIQQVGTSLRVTNLQQAHGFQEYEIAQIGIGSRTYCLPVTSVLSGTEFIANFGDNTLPTYESGVTSSSYSNDFEVTVTLDTNISISIDNTVLLVYEDVVYIGTVMTVNGLLVTIDTTPNRVLGILLQITVPITVQHIAPPTRSFFLSQNNEYAIKPSILGFGESDLLWTGRTVVQTPFTYRLQASTYILLEMIQPVGSARIEHRYKNDNKTTILGKIITLNNPYLDRFFPMKATFYNGIRLEHCHFRLLNPDHTLYKLHGHHWQATFRLYTSDRQIS